MNWSIPAKTFLLGEYLAMAGGPAIVVTTTPCFELSLSEQPGLQGIHKESPAGKFWIQQAYQHVGLQWHDPYQGTGGVGASSAQFIGAYLAAALLQNKIPTQAELLDAYFQYGWSGKGARPSGYDLIAQSLRGCVYIERQQDDCQTFAWPFKDIAFLLIHTGKKLATHHHLQTLVLPTRFDELTKIVQRAKNAIETIDSAGMIDAVNAYHGKLAEMALVAEHSLAHIEFFKQQPDIWAVKGCGALGSDVLLLLVPTKREASLAGHFRSCGWNILASSCNLYVGTGLI